MKKGSIFLYVFLGFSAFGHASTKNPISPSDSAQNYKARSYFGVQAGTIGAGVQFSYPLSNMIALRVNGTFMPSINRTVAGTEEGIDVSSDYTFNTGSASLIGDFSFFENKPGIKLAVGAVYSMTSLTVHRTYYEPTYKLDLGYLDLDIKPQLPVNPYVGVVFANIKKSKNVFFSLEMGALYHGKPQVTFTGEGRIAPTANESNEEIIENNIKSLQFYPYVNMQLNFKLKK